MTTIFYKKILGRYEISEISNLPGEEITFEFEEPVDGKLLISNSVFDICGGVCRIIAARLPEGEIAPKLYTGWGMHKIEGFIFKHGAVIQKAPDSDYVRRLSITVDAILHRMDAIEKALGELENKTERKITF